MLLDSEGLQFLAVDKPIAIYISLTVGGLLNAIFGNATEMIMAIYALNKGMIRRPFLTFQVPSAKLDIEIPSTHKYI